MEERQPLIEGSLQQFSYSAQPVPAPQRVSTPKVSAIPATNLNHNLAPSTSNDPRPLNPNPLRSPFLSPSQLRIINHQEQRRQLKARVNSSLRPSQARNQYQALSHPLRRLQPAPSSPSSQTALSGPGPQSFEYHHLQEVVLTDTSPVYHSTQILQHYNPQSHSFQKTPASISAHQQPTHGPYPNGYRLKDLDYASGDLPSGYIYGGPPFVFPYRDPLQRNLIPTTAELEGAQYRTNLGLYHTIAIYPPGHNGHSVTTCRVLQRSKLVPKDHSLNVIPNISRSAIDNLSYTNNPTIKHRQNPEIPHYPFVQSDNHYSAMPPFLQEDGSNQPQGLLVRIQMNSGSHHNIPQIHRQQGVAQISQPTSAFGPNSDRPSIQTFNGESQFWKPGHGFGTAEMSKSLQRQPLLKQHIPQSAIRPVVNNGYGLSRNLDSTASQLPSHQSTKQLSGIAVVIRPSPNRHSFATEVSQDYQVGRPRLGRPPKTSVTARVEIPARSTPPKKLGRPFKDPQAGAAPLNPTSRKRGRPFATPHAAAAAAEKAARKAAGEAGIPQGPESFKKRGRPFKVAPTHVNVPIPDSHFTVFYCEWKGCPAELHNADALHQHILVKHGIRDRETKMIPCQYANCAGGETTETDEGSDEESLFVRDRSPKLVAFQTREHWAAHIEQRHMRSVFWYLGNGPDGSDLDKAVKKSEMEVSPWLYDEDNKQVTPSVKGQKTEGGEARVNNVQRFRKKRLGLYVVFEPIESEGDEMVEA